MRIDILVFDGCPNAVGAEDLVRSTAEELGVNVDIDVIRVKDGNDAIANRFLGSPSIRINGKDLEVEEDESTQYSMRCRVYRDGNTQSGLPSRDLIAQKLRSAMN